MRQFSKRQMGLLISAGLLSVIMMFVVPVLTGALPELIGYLSVFAVYWVCFCIPVAIIYGKGKTPVGLDLNVSPYWVPVIAIVLPIAVFIGADALAGFEASAMLIALSIGAAFINGPLEELAWRRTFRANSEGRVSFEVIGLFFFTLWHVPLYFSKGVSFDHGALGLIGGALMLGAVWMVLARASNSIGWPIVSHTLVNVAGFIPMFAANFSDV